MFTGVNQELVQEGVSVMARTSTASIVIVSIQDLGPEQRGFISQQGPDPKDMGAVRRFRKRFCDEFGVEVSPGRMQVFITNLRRKARRSGGAASAPASPPPFVRMAASCSAAFLH